MTFSDDYASILLPFVEKYKTAKNEKARKVVLKNAADAVSKASNLREDNVTELPKDLPTAISRYIKLSIQKESKSELEDPKPNPKPKKVKQLYTIRDVIKQNYRDLIEEQIPFKTNDPKYISSYQRAVTAVQDNMTEEEISAAEEMAKEWSKQGAPPEVQLKRAKTKLPNEIRKKIEEWKFSSGALIMCLVAYPDGQESLAFHMESSPLVGNSFTNAHKDWKEGMFENFKDWSVKQFSLQELESGDEEVPVQYQKAKDISFEKNRRGFFALPPLQNFKTIKAKQRVIRGYVGAVYRDFTGSQRAAFPFSLAAKDNQTIYSPDCVPEGFTLSDPDHLPASSIISLYNHWLGRQKKGHAPFIILNPSPLHGPISKKTEKAKGKKKADYVEVSDDPGDSSLDKEDAGDEDDDDDVDDDDDDGNDIDDGEVEKEQLPVPRIGPPKGKKNEVPSPKTPPGQTAGPSSQPFRTPNKRGRKPKASRGEKPIVENTGDEETQENPKPKSNKRPADDELVPDTPRKSRKTGPVRKSERVANAEVEETKNNRGRPKRPLGEKDESNPKRTRLGNEKAVKDFPAGNNATSSARISFLKSLCNLPKFASLVDIIPPVPKPSSIPKRYPSWVSWKSREAYLPSEIHSAKSFKTALSLARKDLVGSSQVEAGNVDTPLLLVGLLYREVRRVIEVEPDEETSAPEELVNSSFGRKELDQIEKVINDAQFNGS